MMMKINGFRGSWKSYGGTFWCQPLRSLLLLPWCSWNFRLVVYKINIFCFYSVTSITNSALTFLSILLLTLWFIFIVFFPFLFSPSCFFLFRFSFRRALRSVRVLGNYATTFYCFTISCCFIYTRNLHFVLLSSSLYELILYDAVRDDDNLRAPYCPGRFHNNQLYALLI